MTKVISIKGNEVDFVKLRNDDSIQKKAVAAKLANRRTTRKSVADLLLQQSENVRKVKEQMAAKASQTQPIPSSLSIDEDAKIESGKKITKIVKKQNEN